MQIIEVKNNLVRINYNSSQENLILSGFVVIKDENLSFIGQIMHLEANTKGSFAILKLIFTFDDNGVLNPYNGSIPNSKSELSIVSTQDLLSLLPAENPIYIGELAQQQIKLNLDKTLFEENLLVCSEKLTNNEILTRNIATQLLSSGEKVLIIDLEGEVSQHKIVASEDFKLPLNYNSINFIYEKGLDDANTESKALIQEIFLEMQLYVKTVPEKFIPFNSFKDVVDEQYKTLGIVELVLLKNKLLKFYEAGIFAGEKSEFEILENSLRQNQLTVLDLSKTEPAIQREMISYAYSLLKSMDEKVYTLTNLTNANSDKKLLKQIFQTKTARSTLICPYAFKYLTELKQISKNLILFSPIQQQQDFASYSAFLNKLNSDEFIVYGKSTHNMPLIVKLDDSPQQVEPVEQVEQAEPVEAQEASMVEEAPILSEEEFKVEDFKAEPFQLESLEQEEIQYSQEDLLDEEINQDVDSFYTAPQVEELVDAETSEIHSEDTLTEDDLDFIENFNSHSDLDDDFFSEPESHEEFFAEEPTNEETFGETFEETLEEAFEKPHQETIEIQEDEFAPNESSQVEASIGFEEIEDKVEEESQILDILPAKEANNSIPIYSAEIPSKEGAQPQEFEQGDTVTHVKYGKGVVEKLINYGSKTLCSIQFDNVGRRLLDPSLAEIKKV